MDKVSLIKCNSYELDEVEDALEKSLRLIGGIDSYIKPGMKVLVKCNLLMKKKPEECTTTHPTVVEALVKRLQAINAIPIIGDSPGGLFTPRLLSGIYTASGMADVAQRTGAELNYNTNSMEVSYPEGRVVKKLTVMELLKEVDAVISVAKLKTHGMTLYTGAVKNLFGVIPGMTKAEYHLRMKKVEDFTGALVDICGYVKPVLSIMDGVMGMEGDGPSAGTPRKIGAILASDSPYALDLVCASLVGIDPERVPTVQRAVERGLSSYDLDDIELLGDSFDELLIEDFKLPVTGEISFLHRAFGSNSQLASFLNHHLGPKPYFNYDECIGCGDCQRYCPPKAIEMVNRKPVVDLKECIRCYCCQELCPKKAVDIRRSWFFKAFN
ncbi:MAG: DUF362 domain-containing protein [Clostridiales bacterium]|nr:DUF362 domain-containing protein [Clostridiales bacterium]